MLKYWGNFFAMLSVALIATAFFREDWQAGMISGAILGLVGAWLHGISLSANGGRQ